jgi:hypothetical protein
LRFVKAITKVPKPVAADIEALNVLRNGLAHAFFPENLRSAKPIYKGKDIFSRDGLKRFIEDMSRVSDFFVSFNFGVRRRSASNNLRQEAEGAALRSSSNTDAVQL